MKAQAMAMRQETSPTLILQLATGDAAVGTMRLFQGKVLEALVVGHDADWCIQAKGVAARHAAFYFDGKSFFVTALPGEVVWVDNKRVGETWEQVSAPASIAIGVALIQLSHFTPTSAPKRGEASAVVKLAPTPERGSSTLLEAQPTLFLDMNNLLDDHAKTALPAAKVPSVPPAAKAPSLPPAAKVQSSPPSVVVTPPRTQGSGRRAVTLPSILRGQQMSWKVVGAAALLLGGGAFLMFGSTDGATAPTSAAPHQAPASSSSLAKASAAATSAPAPQKQPAVREASAKQAEALPEPDPLPELEPAPTAPVAAANPPAGKAAQKGLTLQRKAIDALIAGNQKEASDLYAALVKEEPSNIAAREALRILRRSEADDGVSQ